MERFYYKDSKGSLFNLKSPDFIKYSEVEEKFYQTDENGEPILDENGEQIYYTEKKRVADGLLDGYTQITKEEYEKLTKPKELTTEQKAAQEKARKIAEYKKYLKDTDYIAAKIAEANFNSDTAELVELHKQYDSIILQRKGWREAINKLEVK